MRRGTGQADAFLEMFELVDAAEAWGLDIVWLAEMLINPARSVLSAPLLVASWIAARTRHVRMGTAVQLLPLNHPLRVAGEVTTLDHLSQGRFDFGIGRSGGTRGYDALGVPYEESQARFFEALEIILEAWKGEPFSYDGRFFKFTDVTVSPRPGSAAPPAVPAATTAETFPRVGRTGLADLRRAARHGHSRAGRLPARLSPGVARGGGIPARATRACASRSTPPRPNNAAREEPRDTITYYFERQAHITLAPIGRAGTGPVEQRQTQAQRLGQALLRRDPRQESRLRHRSGPGRSPRAAPRGAGRRPGSPPS